jgi:hypothetical protein
MANEFVITIASDFTEFPGGRYRVDGKFSGEEFRDDVLVPALRTHEHVTVVLDGTAGYPSSFIEEAFGGLVRLHGFSRRDLETKLTVVANDSHYETYRLLAQKYIREARPEAAMVA